MSSLDRYRDEVGGDALERQQSARAQGRCDYCWADPGQPHTGLCPNRADDEAAAPTSQDEALF